MKQLNVLLLAMLVGLGMSGIACKTAGSMVNSATGSTSQPAGGTTSKPSMLTTGVAGASALVKLLGGKDEAAKTKAKQQLLGMGAKALPALIGALKGGTNETKKGALDVIGKMGKKASSATTAVKGLTTSADKTVSSAAKNTLTKIQ